MSSEPIGDVVGAGAGPVVVVVVVDDGSYAVAVVTCVADAADAADVVPSSDAVSTAAGGKPVAEPVDGQKRMPDELKDRVEAVEAVLAWLRPVV